MCVGGEHGNFQSQILKKRDQKKNECMKSSCHGYLFAGPGEGGDELSLLCFLSKKKQHVNLLLNFLLNYVQ